MRRLQEEVSEQAATAAMLHKFNSGASEPTGEVTRSHLTQGLQATKEVSRLSLTADRAVRLSLEGANIPKLTILLYTSGVRGWSFAVAAADSPL